MSSQIPTLELRSDAGEQFAVRRFAGPLAHVGELRLRVAHLTDLHVGRVTPYEIQQNAVQLVNKARPDLVAITGDFVCHSQLYLDQLKAIVAAFYAPVVCVLGNHDYWAGAAEVRRALHGGGAEVLDNANTRITLRRQTLQLVGLDDSYTGHALVEKATSGLSKNLPTLGLSHIAEEADALWAHGVPLVLSGHTHAGQVTLARMNELALGRLFGHRYIHGLYGRRLGHGAVYVGAGVGASVMPLRLGERGRREITFFELGAAPGAFVEPLGERAAHSGRKPSEKLNYRRAALVVKKERKRKKRRD